jgi:hypothetical protein
MKSKKVDPASLELLSSSIFCNVARRVLSSFKLEEKCQTPGLHVPVHILSLLHGPLQEIIGFHSC